MKSDFLGECGSLFAILVLGLLFIFALLNLISLVCMISLFQAAGVLIVLGVVSLIWTYVKWWYRQ